ncbi:hypothetical protein H257_14078 [Aphanomyces astaci]|uniref:Uncharacterized protein n=2 Tax=Aphanomyces astaci TaxID=112090 RepID=W4FSB5_APHAT|nr:hypothetical protein H257_14078 [Aphanomyces astaci]ETV70400.1 hypothetical protein H257_14078 [Aphanomyces astaci]RHY05937.1 hypothetical protein DYB36_009141 [Aphanomyces astaci]RHY46234.1 hypothetical protein DYB34_010679 [Aphanomyces astaci]RHY60596.1 hypothetical protein DYB38_001131 [Aphanomyces astaci]RHY72959.1 hypothetical protein DYB30_002711 [Aphanomyces astaci]|eukprot:XP_009840112.1 hypothetical protein H257_14078 [Aphanomyces astaci]
MEVNDEDAAVAAGAAPSRKVIAEIKEYEAHVSAMKNFNESLRQLSDNIEVMTQTVEQTNKLAAGWLRLWHK